MKRTLCTVLGLVCVTASAGAYVREPSNFNPRSLPVHYRINQATIPPGLGTSTGVMAVESGFTTWATPACTAWRAVDDGDTTLTARAGDRQSVILWRNDWPGELGDPRVTIGVTTPVWSTGGYFIDADIQFNNYGFRWNTTGAGSYVDAQSIATHEEGHFLGLGHTPVRNAVMLASYSGGTKRSLDPDDVMGVCAIYPSGMTAGCTSDAMCGSGQHCVSGTCVTAPADAGMSGGGTFGTPCSSSSGCASGLTCTCERTSGECLCTQPCSASRACPSGPWSCYTTSTGGICWHAESTGSDAGMSGGGGTGDRCTSGADCLMGLCLRTSTGGVCTQRCTDDCTCPANFTCGMTTSGFNACGPGTNQCSTGTTDAGTPPADTGTSTTDAGRDTGVAPEAGDGGTADGGDGSDSGCHCGVAGGATGTRAVPWLVVALAAFAARRRRR